MLFSQACISSWFQIHRVADKDLEPTTIEGLCLPVLVTGMCHLTWLGGAGGRTQGFVDARQAFCQVAYVPNSFPFFETEAQVAQVDLSLNV